MDWVEDEDGLGFMRERISEMRVIAGVKWKHVPRTSKVALGDMLGGWWWVVRVCEGTGGLMNKTDGLTVSELY